MENDAKDVSDFKQDLCTQNPSVYTKALKKMDLCTQFQFRIS